MTFKALSNIIKKHKEQPTQLVLQSQDLQQEQDIAEAQANINTLKANHDRAYEERKANWEREHPGKEFYQRIEEDDRRDCVLDEWYWNFFQRVHTNNSPEVRYQLERNPAHGFGHKSRHHGLDDECIQDCRFYEPKGKLTIFDILGDYRGYQQFDDVWQAYKELEREESIPTE
jgi:hypothetical protein